MSVELRDRPLFICGHPKSGTSLITALLDSHPQLVVYPEESVFFRRYFPLAGRETLERQLELAEQFLIHIFTWERENQPPSQEGYPDRDYTAISFNAVREVMGAILEDKGVRHPGDVLSAAVLAFGQVTGQCSEETLYWVEKSPYNERFADQIFEWWPEARCIHLVRDPRDNYASYRKKHPNWTPEFFAWDWWQSLRKGLRNQKRFGAQRYWILRYEDIVLEPDVFVQKLCMFLGIKSHPGLWCPSRVGIPWGGNSMFGDRFEGISSSPLGRWKETLTINEARVIEAMLTTSMARFSYACATAPSTRERFYAFLWKTRYWLSSWKAALFLVDRQ